MQIPRYQPVRKLGFNMTPMIDVVFLLIIFFLVSSHLQKQETQQELDLPVAASADNDIDQETPRVTVNVLDSGELLVAGRPLTQAQLIPMLKAVRDEKGEDIEVRIRSSRSAPWSKIEPVMLSCTKSGIWNVGFAVYRKEGG
ncbi:ExbD/TolR family protein [Mariniblastus fucicola]|uniref:Biopolymer transport protein ExbD n=1 Tax=Mariniblastus fucicola TaxID=980251 RepID=A0A5B9PH40_9BACT|nr:biopolymer transporter ExbD [Mariniblastus fucicola]QEG24600.1 biopolymer transport protein ExbD [Mariniblastus fucicola]